jgi:hypothetical protein
MQLDKEVVKGFSEWPTNSKECLLKQLYWTELSEGLVGNKNFYQRYQEFKASLTDIETKDFQAVLNIIDKRTNLDLLGRSIAQLIEA